MKNFILTLVASRKNKLLKEHIDIARDIVQSREELITLSEGEAVDIPCQEPVSADINKKLSNALGNILDYSLLPRENRRKKILISDMDSTIVDNETLDEVAHIAGTGEIVENITRRSMQGNQDFTHSLQERVACLKGQPQSILEDAWKKIRLIDGAKELVGTMHKYGSHTVLISGGFTFFTSRIAKICHFDENYANQFLFTDEGTFTGEIGNTPLDGEAKKRISARIAKERHCTQADILAIGDGSNDIPMLDYAKMGIAFHAKSIVKEQIGLQINHGSLQTALYMQGYPKKSFVKTC